LREINAVVDGKFLSMRALDDQAPLPAHLGKYEATARIRENSTPVASAA
jgi:hypothetical protein